MVRRNLQFDTALQFVRAHYAHLFTPHVGRIALVPADGVRFGRALCWSNGQPATIQIMNGRRRTSEFVNTLVHEITHVAQFATGRNTLSFECEMEACVAGDQAAQHYNESE